MKPGSSISDAATHADPLAGWQPRLSVLQKSMLDATPDCIKLLSLDGRLMEMNHAGYLALDVPENSKLGMVWLSLLPKDVREGGAEALKVAVSGTPARFPGRSVTPIGQLFWDNLLTPVLDDAGKVAFIICVSRDVTEKVQLERSLEIAIDRERLLSGEMQHRIKNLFSLVSGLIYIAEKEVKKNTRQDITANLLEKLGALSRASDVAFGRGGTGDSEVCLKVVLGAVLLPYGDKCRVDGPPVRITRDNMSNIALVFHELATNSIKYGALAAKAGHIVVAWTADDLINLTWSEVGGPEILSQPERHGFGSQMVDRIVRFAGGKIKRSWLRDGLVIELQLSATGKR